MIANFPRRARIDLNGVWRFGVAERPADHPPPARSLTERLPVPGVWETTFRHFRHRGYGWYQRDFDAPLEKPANLRLVFEAVSHTAKVWLDREFLGEHYGAHTRFEFTRKVAPGPHTLTVLACNAFGPGNPLTTPRQDIFTWGGIPRSVHAEALPEQWISSATALPLREGRRWLLDASIAVEGGRGSVECLLEGRKIGEIALDAKGRGAARLPVGSIAPWSPEDPNLYAVVLRHRGDVWQERIGFRTVEVRGRRILLNGKPIVLKGVNRHEFHPDFGPALPAAVHLRDIEILKKLGANFVRGSHYPNDPLFLDLCDEKGILFWDELSHWGARAEEMAGDAFMRRSLEQAEEMVVQHRHHPCVILWGMLNEAQTDTAVGRRAVRRLAARLRQLDPTRPVTFACDRPARDRSLDLVDVVSVNMYPGWYIGGLAELDATVGRMLDDIKRRSRGKPVIISEYGAAGVTGVRSFELRKWTEDYQAELVGRLIARFRESGFISGAAVWQFCDVRTSDALWNHRVREYNNKGIVSEHREPKAAFDRVAEEFAKPWRLP